MSLPAVFLDRDGVINEVRMAGTTASAPRTVQELAIVPGAAQVLERLANAGLRLFVVSNQPDVARGDLSLQAVEAINAVLCRELPLDAVYYCPHDTPDGCTCRKPQPGLLLRAAAEWDIDLGRSWLVGDRWVDLLAAQRAGVEPILLQRPWSWQPTSAGPPPAGLAPSGVGESLGHCVDIILGSASSGAAG
ncbi:MAG: HAD family hydrolase [Actinomycetota bacterium]